MSPYGVLETAVYATDLDAAEAFYRQVIGLELFARDGDRHLFFRCEAGVFLVFNPELTGEPTHIAGHIAVPPHGSRGAGHMAFGVRHEDLHTWRARLAARGVAIEQAITWPNGGESLYFRDPAGNSIELATPRLWGLEEPA